MTELSEASLEAALEQQAEPVVWDIPSASFDEWWDSDRRRDNANPFTTDSFAYWAFEGWQAAQQKANPFSPEAINTTQTAWQMGYEAAKEEQQAEPLSRPTTSRRRHD